mmetsp:Transcript_89500/g.158880  ORF Transcript_89500/g.158880 Transcript_89500/m.158880 type:complete len:536 (-) Transcript_89500:72-1679(-)
MMSNAAMYAPVEENFEVSSDGRRIRVWEASPDRRLCIVALVSTGIVVSVGLALAASRGLAADAGSSTGNFLQLDSSTIVPKVAAHTELPVPQSVTSAPMMELSNVTLAPVMVPTPPEPVRVPHDRLVLLGEGACIDQSGSFYEGSILRQRSSLRSDGSSPECEAKCLNSGPACTGYQVENATCFLMADGLFRPSAVREQDASFCFWRQTFLKDSGEVFPAPQPAIPKIIWSFWQDPETTPDQPLSALPDFIDACIASMKAVNPDYDVRVLDDKTAMNWLTPEELPPNYASFSIQHRSDCIRLALLSKYGGVWADASTLMTQPMDQILGDDPMVRTFLYVPYFPWVDPTLIANDVRVDWDMHLAVWFVAAPKQDMFVSRLKECVWQFMLGANRSDFSASGMYTPLQLQIMKRLGIRAYLSSDACMFKIIDEDAAIWDWYHSDRVKRKDATGRLGYGWLADMQTTQDKFFHRTDPDWFHTLVDDPSLYMKFTSSMRKYLVLPVSPSDIWCKQNTFRMVLDHIGVDSETRCANTMQIG